ncbi:hypothetical protein [Streptomyces luteireticuli]|uniref:hypothetical protein n=1 Tax=Streptomyces luteireticuli TaxID=173858 RepID=UPI003555C0BB
MRTYIGYQEAANTEEFEELALGFESLFLGRPGESGEDRAARSSAARDILAELWEESHSDEIALLNALYAAQLSQVSKVVTLKSKDTAWQRTRAA